jgi:hypothetical protein
MKLRLFWLGVIEATRPELCPSFFQVDLAPAILGFLGCDDTPSPLDPATLGSLHRDNTLPLAPPTLGSPRRGDTSSLLATESLWAPSDGDDTSPPLIPEIPGVLGRDDTPPPLAPEVPRTLRRSDTVTPHPPPFPAYISRHPARSPPTPSFPVPSILENTHPATPARPISPTVQLAGTTPNHQNIAPAMLSPKPSPSTLASRLAMQRGPRPFARSRSYCAYASVLCNILVNNA